MPEIDGLGALEVRVAGHRPIGVALGDIDDRRHQRCRQLDGPIRRSGYEEGQVSRHLVVSRTAGMELPAQRADDLGQPAFDRHMDVLIVLGELEGSARELVADLLETFEHLGELVVGQDTGAAQGLRVGFGARDVLLPQTLVEADRSIDPLEERVLGLV